jgi:hypothetical protein
LSGSLLLPATVIPRLTPQVNIHYGNHPISCLVDTGASHSFFNLSFVQKLRLPFQREPLPSVLIGNSSRLNPIGTIQLKFKLSHKTYTHTFYIMENLPFSCVLGVDFIKSSRMIINIAQGTYHFANKSQHNFQFTNQETLMALQGLTPTQEDDVARLIKKFNTISTETLGCTNWFSCELKVEGPPIAQKPYKVSPFKSEVIKKHVNRMLQMGVIRPSDSEWASPVTLSKEGDEFRFCLDYRQLNKRCKSDPYPVPRIDSLLHRLGDACFISIFIDGEQDLISLDPVHFIH